MTFPLHSSIKRNSDSENCHCDCSSSELGFSSNNNLQEEFSGKLKLLMAHKEEYELKCFA